ncbi:Uncharacterised protein [Sphingobacterium spiritivorum]|uniref:DUF5977 domain-containing protein n=1 Tax=Sphingobacterium spiritivorum TaxID=258 RepID=A0A380C110_SPHSI|nr:DUF5977 domain-containing protein [Sphingobacterium spiritivorum]SUJ10966.1 Uncharacterised protein [Sphingobacterium spiritivorum]
MKVSKPVLILLALCSLYKIVYSQSVQKDEKFYPKSPNATMSQKFQEFPVEYSNGLPTINIPLYNLEVKGINIPITLKYHAGGIKTSEESSWVGLGWSLDCGGLITRNVKGNPDEGVLQQPRLTVYPLNDPNTGLYEEYHIEPPLQAKYNITGGVYADGEMYSPAVINQIKDSYEQWNTVDFGNNNVIHQDEKLTASDEGSDVYYLNVPGMGGKFMLDQYSRFKLLNSEEQPHIETEVLSRITTWRTHILKTKPTPQSLEMSYTSFIFGKWKIRDEKGLEYSLGNSSINKFFVDSVGGNEINEWYLDKIVNKNSGDSVLFEYQEVYREKSDASYAFRGEMSGLPSIEQIDIGSLPGKNSSRVSLLTRIKGTDIQAIFYRDNRYNIGNKLDSIIILDRDNKKLQKIVFYYDLFRNSNRLKLRGVEVRGKDDILKGSPYMFTYDETFIAKPDNPLSSEYTAYAQDYYGYYNRRTVPVPGVNDFAPQWPYTRLESLIGIIHPTGATTSYEFEPNTYSATFSDWNSLYNPLSSSDAGGMRIRKITHRDNATGNMQIKEFDYTSDGIDLSTGFLTIPPEKAFYISQYGVSKRPVMLFNRGSNRYEQIIGGAIVQYGQVTEKNIDNGFSAGKIEYIYHNYSPGDTPGKFYNNVSEGISDTNIGNFPNYFAKNEYTNLLAGRLKEKREYNSVNSILTREVYEYDIKSSDQRFAIINRESIVDNPWWNPSGMSPALSNNLYYKYINYFKLYNKLAYLNSTTKYAKDVNSGVELITKTINYHDSPNHNKLTMTKSVSSGTDTLTNRYVYALDYANQVEGNTVFQLLKTARINQLIASYTFRGQRLISSNIQLFKNFGTASSPALYPESIYTYLKGSSADFTSYNLLNNLSYPVGMLFSNVDFTKELMSTYSIKGNILSQKLSSNPLESYLWSDRSNQLIAKVSNAAPEEIAFTSFEPTAKGTWTFDESQVINDGFASQKGFSLSVGPISRNNLQTTQNYTLSYWVKGTSPLVVIGSVSVAQKAQVGNWTCFEHNITGVNALNIEGTGIIDELRLMPNGAHMTSYSYDSGFKLMVQSNDNALPTHYQYDGLGRLEFVQDFKRNILQQYNVNEVRNIIEKEFFSPEIKSSFSKVCPTGYLGSKETYMVPYGRYTSMQDPFTAYQLALDDLHTNGQNYADAIGSCSPAPSVYSSRSYEKNFDPENCATGLVPIRAVYNVPTGKYESSVSQAEADAKAAEDLLNNGQAYVNRTGVCKSMAESHKITLKTHPDFRGARATLYVISGGNIVENFPLTSQTVSFYVNKSPSITFRLEVIGFPPESEPVLNINGQNIYNPQTQQNYINLNGSFEITVELSGAII